MEIKVKQLSPKIANINFDDQDLMVNHFIRFSEWYESANKKFYHKDFTKAEALIDYKKTRGLNYDTVTQAFNLPIASVIEAFKVLTASSSEEIFIHNLCLYLRNYGVEYLISTYGDGTDNERAHEVAHALYFVDSYYREQMNQLFDELPLPIRDALVNYLKNENYNESVYKDEAQAYMATGLDDMPKIKQVQKHRADFIDVFLNTARNHGITLWD